MTHKYELKRVETLQEVRTYLARLDYALFAGNARIYLQKRRERDKLRDKKYTNRYTMGKLFPDEDEIEALKRELKSLCVEEYIETVMDKRFPKRSEMRVFGRNYLGKDVYIKIRVELMNLEQASGNDLIFIMSFHFSTHDFKADDFPYRKG